jgi:Domain of unknown function (DUF4276)
MKKVAVQTVPPTAFLLEGYSDEPVIRELMKQLFNRQEALDYSLHHHRGKGQIPNNPRAPCNPRELRLLGRLPATLRGMAKERQLVIILIDLDDNDKSEQIEAFKQMLVKMEGQPLPPRVLFCFAVEEVESWFIADFHAVGKAYEKSVDLRVLRKVGVDAVCGAAEKLGEALGHMNPKFITGALKAEWASKISPHLNFLRPVSPSFRRFIRQLAVNRV